jgi:glycosyltransferase involved in cell wall biosynthesis
MKRKKLVIFHPALAPYRIDFFNQLAERFESIFYFSLNNVPDQKFNQDELQKKIQFKYKILSGFNLFDRTVRFGIFNILNREKPDIVLCSEYNPVTYTVLLFKRLINKNLRVYTINDDSIDLSIKRKGVRKIAKNLASNYLDGIIFPSENVGQWFNANVNSKINVFELPIIHDNESFRQKLSTILSISENYVRQYNLFDKKVFLFVGRLVKIKNIEFLIKAFSKSRQEKDILIIVGDGEEYESLKHIINELNLKDSCILTGRFDGDELIAWYNVAQNFILPSILERYGAVVNEALLSGCKVLCSEIAGASNLINGKNGFVFNPADTNQLSEQIKVLSSSSNPVLLPLHVKPDLMPFNMNEKLEILFNKFNEI